MGAFTPSRSPVVRFSVFELDVRWGELRKSGVRVSLQDQPLKLLESLLERPGELVTRDALRRRLWPGDTFVDLEQGLNAAVKRLREALGDSADSPRFVETLPRKGYRLIAPVERDIAGDGAAHASTTPAVPSAAGPSATGPSATPSRRPRWRRVATGVAVLGILIVASGWGWMLRPSRPGPAASPMPPRVMPLTTLAGSEHTPAFSPDGSHVAFAWEGDARDNSDIYVTLVGSSEVRRLTTDAARDFGPQWSPDGRRIAYASCQEWQYRSNCHVQVLDLDASLAPAAAPRRLTRHSFWTINGLTWSRDATFIVFSARQGGLNHLWRVDADGARAAERIEIAGIEVTSPVTAPVGDRLVYSRTLEDEDIYRFDPPGSARPIAQSSLMDTNAHFSPDGRRMVYCSARSGDALELWMAGSDGSQPERLTRGPGGWQCSPSWSPGGKHIAFDSRAEDGSWHVWTIGVDGGIPRQITAHAGDQVRPTWSRDGRWLYFIWKHDGTDDIWRIPWPGGPPERVTHGGSVSAGRESTDGTGIWYKRDLGDTPLFFQPLAGGAARPVIPCVASGRFAIGRGGLYYMPCQPAGSRSHDARIRVLNVTTGEDRFFGTLNELLWPPSGRTDGCFAISPDGRMLLYSRLANRGADLMLIENFK